MTRPTSKQDPARHGADSAGGGDRIAILGQGQMGLVCAGILCASASGAGRAASNARRALIDDASGDGAGQGGACPASVTIWSHSADEAGELTQTRTSDRLPGFKLPDSVRVTADLVRAVDGASLIVTAIPVQFIREVWVRLKGRLPREVGVVSVSKGIENNTLLRPTQIVADALGDDPDSAPRPLGVLSGPTIATELARGLPATMIAASETPHFAELIQQRFSTHYLRVYTHDDTLGVEVAGAMKNVIAIAAGVLDGLQAGFNAKSALLARGLAEIARLGAAMGARNDTFFGIAGVGDLATTCFSPEGRNRTLGEALGRGKTLDQALKSTHSVVEGVATTRSVMDLAAKYRVEMPIAHAVHAVLFEKMDPIDAIGRLMSRSQKAERVR